jgi:DNA uptake protein ComE-like DNA-binding protein
MTLPNMTPDIANSILDWIDPDDEPRTNGAESDYYESLSPPYQAKNGPLDSLEELLLVKGVTPQLLLGNDRNRNGVLEPDEDDGTGTLDRGWLAYLTVYSREQNVDSQGNPRINVNDPDLNTLYQNLTTAVGQDLANYILAYRTYGPASGAPGSGNGGRPSPGPSPAGGATAGNVVVVTGRGQSSQTGSTIASGGGAAAAGGPQLSFNQINTRGGSRRSIASLYELVNSSVSIPGNTPQAPATTYPSPLRDPSAQQQLLPQLLDECTTVKATEIPARINVNTAAQTVLSALPGLTDADVQSILDNRPDPTSTDPPDPIYQTTAWLITRANFSPAKLQSLERYITARTQVYRIQVVGYFDAGGPTCRLEAIIDTNQGQPRILALRDLTELGKGFNLDNPQGANP